MSLKLILEQPETQEVKAEPESVKTEGTEKAEEGAPRAEHTEAADAISPVEQAEPASEIAPSGAATKAKPVEAADSAPKVEPTESVEATEQAASASESAAAAPATETAATFTIGGYNGADQLREKVNSLLPEFIRVWDITRVQNGFDARNSCDSRQYEYLLPTYVFLPPKPNTAMYNMLEKARDAELERNKTAAGTAATATAVKEEGAKTESVEASTTAPAPASAPVAAETATQSETQDGDLPGWESVLNHPFWAEQGVKYTYSEDLVQKKKWRISTEQVARIRKIFEQYLGSHNFHNFTVGKEFRDRASNRFMKKVDVSEPKLINGTEWLSIKLHGQSFMLHQIRKMIGLLVLVGRTNTPPWLVPELFGPSRVHVPKAPGLGLLLENPLFESYNTRIASQNRRMGQIKQAVDDPKEAERLQLDKQVRESIAWDGVRGEMEQFKQKFIYDRIIQTEEKTAE